jgi:plasmid stabilization system protein ParE
VKYRVVWTESASVDLLAIVEYLAERSATAAENALKRIDESAQSLTTMPFRGRIVPELREHGIDTVREVIVRPWRVLYTVKDDVAVVYAVIDSRRNIEDVLLERALR